MSLNYKEVLDKVAEICDTSQENVDNIISSTVEILVEQMAKGEKVDIKGLGVFRSTWFAPRSVETKNGTEHRPGHRVPKVAFHKAVKDSVR